MLLFLALVIGLLPRVLAATAPGAAPALVGASGCTGPLAGCIALAVAGVMGVPVQDVVVEGLTAEIQAMEAESWEVKLPVNMSPLGVVSVSTVAHLPDGSYRRMVVRPRIEAWGEAPVAEMDVLPGQPVALKKARIPLSTLNGSPPADIEKPWLAKSTLQAGEAVTIGEVRPVPDAIRGSDVAVVVETRGIRVEAPGRLSEDAFVGQTVRVTNLFTQKGISGVYQADGTVLVGVP